MKLFNTLSKSIEDFKPINENSVALYTCGPTVYNYAHIGNLRTYIFEDLLRRSLEYAGFSVNHVMNMTDVDDKTIKASDGKQKEFKDLTKKFENAFLADLDALNIKHPTEITRATEYIDQIVEFISDLLDRGYAYEGDDGSIYFSIDKFKDYGKLSGLDKEGIQTGARVSQDEYTKDNPADFALWKAWDEADGEIFWQTKLGKGRPGWHIECSAMSQDKLGSTIDIHAGAVDLVFPHHENEIAQSEARTGEKFVNFWVHGEHLLVDGKKMSKSLGNIYLLADIEKKGFSPLDFRYLCLTAKYRDKLNFTWESLKAAQISRERLLNFIWHTENENMDSPPEHIDLRKGNYHQQFIDKLNNDLNIPESLAVMWEMVRDNSLSPWQRHFILQEMDKVFGLGLFERKQEKIHTEIQKLVDEREKARENKNFARADEMREQIEKMGYVVEDMETGTKIYKK